MLKHFHKPLMLGALLTLFAAPAMAQIMVWGGPAYAPPPPPPGWYEAQRQAAWQRHEWREHQWREHQWAVANGYAPPYPYNGDDDDDDN
ncbi:hypothetical protein [Acidocella sp.]|uniref:hypothetical protein n=1 Tax=Acidocella sp. TaxID=50710 RepID=UPI002622F06A|nr:hypothetical protein [Acidocella sp.]